MTLTYHLLDSDDFTGPEASELDDLEVDSALMVELATCKLAGLRLAYEPDILHFIEDMGYSPAAPWLQRHDRLIDGISQAMTIAAEAEFQRLVDARLFPVDLAPPAVLHEVKVSVKVMAQSPASAAAMVGAHVQYNMPVQFVLVEVEPGELAHPDAGNLLGTGPSGEFPVLDTER